MASQILNTLLLLPVLLSTALGQSPVQDLAQGSSSLASGATRPVVRFYGPDYVPSPLEHKMFVAPVFSDSPVEQGEAFDTIKSILAQHGLSVKLNHADIVSPNSKNAPQQHAFAVTANHHANQKAIIDSFAENQTTITTPPVASYGDSMPWFGDGYCCFEGCPPGSCPSIHVSTINGSIFPTSEKNTQVCPCRGHGYCCCAGCPTGTCGQGGC